MATLTDIAKDNGKTLPPGKVVALKQVRWQKGEVHPTQGLVVNNIRRTFCFHRMTAGRLKSSSPLSTGGLHLPSFSSGE